MKKLFSSKSIYFIFLFSANFSFSQYEISEDKSLITFQDSCKCQLGTIIFLTDDYKVEIKEDSIFIISRNFLFMGEIYNVEFEIIGYDCKSKESFLTLYLKGEAPYNFEYYIQNQMLYISTANNVMKIPLKDSETVISEWKKFQLENSSFIHDENQRNSIH